MVTINQGRLTTHISSPKVSDYRVDVNDWEDCPMG